MKKILSISILIVFSCLFNLRNAAGQDIRGKITVGYQGWFACPGDGSPINAWWHWTGNWSQPPSPTNKGMVSWPEMSGYSTTFQTAFSNLGNGEPATVFSSYTQQTVDTHFAWMAMNGIHCAALQRFSPFGGEGPTRDSMAIKVKNASEAKGVKFYIMYDVTNWTNMQSQIKEDWTNKMSLLTSSPAYAREDNKPVVVIWGFGFSDNARPFTPEACQDVIDWFKAQGCYVGGGVPTHWRTQTEDSRPGFIDVYHSFDMISPWMVGRIGSAAGSDNFYTDINVPDVLDCNAHGIDYQPCVMPGDLQSGHRDNGEFMWRQFYNMIRAGSHAIYISMYDEYNESNQILPTSDSYLSTPTNYGFRTTSSEGIYISPDYYLRLTDEGGRMLAEEIPLSETNDIPLQSAPMWYRSSFEQGYDAQLTWGNSVAHSASVANISNAICDSTDSKAYVGKWSLQISGVDNSNAASYITFKAIDVAIDVTSNTNLTFITYPEDSLGRFVSVDLLLNDSTKLSDLAATDYNGISMQANVGRGEIQKWNKTTCNIGQWLNGKSIDKILITYDHADDKGTFTAYIDNISIYNGIPDTTDLLPSFPYNESPFNGEECDSVPLSLLWEAVDYDQTFKVYVSKNINIKETDLKATIDTVGLTIPISYKSTYYWRVDQESAAGKTMGPVWTFTTPEPFPPVYGPNPINGSTEKDTALTLKWNAAHLGQNFKVYLSDETPLTNLDLLSIQTDTFFVVTGLDFSKTYYWKIDQSGVNGITEGDVWSFSTKMFPQQASNPRPANNSTDRDTALTIYWDPGLHSESHELYFGTSPILTENDFVISQGRLSYKLSGLELGTTYYWRVDEVNTTGKTKGAVWKFTTILPSNVDEEKYNGFVPAVFPNPVSNGEITVDLGTRSQINYGTIAITSLQGQEILKQSFDTNNPLKLNLANLKSGVYLVTINTNYRVFTSKLVVK